MKYKFQIHLDDNDYLEFNKFHMLRSPYGKKQIMSLRMTMCAITLAMVLISLIINSFSIDSFISVIPLLVIITLFQISLKKITISNLKSAISRAKKKGKMPYSPSSVIEFFDEGFMETTKDQRTEQKYSALERVCVVEGKYVYLYVNNIMAHIIPNVSFDSREQYKEFLSFINEKCPNIDFYK